MIKDTAIPGSVSETNEEIVPYEMVEDPTIQPETDQEAEARGQQERWLFWDKQIKAAMVAEKRFRKEAEECEDDYFGPDTDNAEVSNKISEKTALIHANIDVLKPLMFSDTPVPIVRRRFRGDGKAGPVQLMAADLGQRLAEYLLDTEPFQDTIEAARDDWLIAGRGQARAVYKADFTQSRAQMGEQQAATIKSSERVTCRHTEWRRFLSAAGHRWETTPWIAFEIPMTRTAIERRFPDAAERMRYPKTGIVDNLTGSQDHQHDINGLEPISESNSISRNPFDTVMVWEIWNRDSKEVIWYTEGYPFDILDAEPDPLHLENFFPCPKPLLATTKNGSMTPRPDIKYYERRAEEIQIATEKMRDILKVLSVSGLCPGAMMDEVNQLLDGKSTIVPIEAWLSLMEKGGTNGIIDWLPIQHMVSAVQALAVMREGSKNAMFEASGVSDIMRAQGDPTETATAQQIKGRYAGMRLSERQRRAAFFARDLLRIMFEIGIEQFDLQTLADITALDIFLTKAERIQAEVMQQLQIQAFQAAMQQHQAMTQYVQQMQAQGVEVPPLPPAPEEPQLERLPATSYEEVLEVLRQDFGRKITLTIETDSTILSDEASDKEARIEFLTAFASLTNQLMPMALSGQVDMPTVKELLLFGVRAFPKTRSLEAMITEIPDEVQQQPQEDTAVQVAKIRGEVDKMLAEMESEDKERDRQHEMKMKGVEMIEDGARMAAEAAAIEPPQPQGIQA